jgi:hypothetical protein
VGQNARLVLDECTDDVLHTVIPAKNQISKIKDQNYRSKIKNVIAGGDSALLTFAF